MKQLQLLITPLLRSRRQLVHCDDLSAPQVVPLQDVLNAQAYVLMHQRESFAEDATLVDDVEIL